MIFFVDPSALFAMLSADDENHAKAKQPWHDLLTHDEELVATNNVLVETFALVQHCLGMAAVRSLSEEILPVLQIDECTSILALLATSGQIVRCAWIKKLWA